MQNKTSRSGRPKDAYWLYGRHAVRAALANPARRCHHLMLTSRDDIRTSAEVTIAKPREISELLPPGAVHQGMAVLVDPLPDPDLAEILSHRKGQGVVVAIDQVTDPQNVGAILRSADAFGAAAVILPRRHAPASSGSLAKAASGTLETVPLVRAANLVRTLDRLKGEGFWIVGLDMEAPDILDRTTLPDRCVLVLGAEDRGMRRLTRETCDLMVRIPMTGTAGSLNVSACAAVALHEWARQNRP